MTGFLRQGNNISLSDIIALLALVVAAVSLGWNVLNEVRNYPRAKIRVMIGHLILRPGMRDNNDYFTITIINNGKRPINIKGIGYTGYLWWWLPKRFKTFVLMPKQLPIILKESEDHIEYYAYKPDDFKKLLDTHLQSIFVYDSIGRNHRLSRVEVFRFRHEIRKHLKGDSNKRKV